MVAVDVSFLAVQSVQTQDEVIILLYTSTFSAMCSLLITLSLVTQVNEQLRGSNTAVVCSSFHSFILYYLRPQVSYLSRMAAGSVLDSESFPFMLSLPFGFLLLGQVPCHVSCQRLIVRQSILLHWSTAVCDSRHFYLSCQHHYIFSIDGNGHSSMLASTFYKCYFRLGLAVVLALHVVPEHEPIHCILVEQDHRTSVAYGHYPFGSLSDFLQRASFIASFWLVYAIPFPFRGSTYTQDTNINVIYQRFNFGFIAARHGHTGRRFRSFPSSKMNNGKFRLNPALLRLHQQHRICDASSQLRLHISSDF